MKKYLLFFVTCLCASLASAQEEYNPGDHDNRIYLELEETDEPEEMPVNICLFNPTTSMAGVSMYLYIDDNTVDAWSYDEDDEVNYDINRDRCNKNSTVDIFMTEESNVSYPEYLYFSVTYKTDFKGTDGTLVTIYIDATKLTEGNHVLHVVDPLCSYVGADFSTASYLCNNSELPFTFSNGLITLMNPLINADSKNNVCLDLQGRRVNNATKGIYIVNGKKVIK